MKKIIAAVICLTLMTAALSGCESAPQSSALTIEPSQLSQETQRILDIFNEDIHFFDYTVDERVKSISVLTWIKEDGGEWQSEISTTATDFGSDTRQLAFKIDTHSIDIYELSDSGHSGYKSTYGIDFSDTLTSASTALSSRRDIALNEEIVLFVKIGDQSNQRPFELDSFRDADCKKGIAMTVVFSDSVPE